MGVGADGKTRTVTQMRTNAQGQALSITYGAAHLDQYYDELISQLGPPMTS